MVSFIVTAYWIDSSAKESCPSLLVRSLSDVDKAEDATKVGVSFIDHTKNDLLEVDSFSRQYHQTLSSPCFVMWILTSQQAAW